MSTSSSYVAGKRPVNMYPPRSSVTAVRTALVPMSVSVTVAPGTTPPVVSSTVPRSVAVVVLT
jgi:hypothetical protein